MPRKGLKTEVVLPTVMLIVLVSVGWAKMDQSGNRRWEYTHLQLSSSQMHESDTLLTNYGLQKWELVAVVRENPGGTTYFYFKRGR